jgi:hypothetical protein
MPDEDDSGVMLRMAAPLDGGASYDAEYRDVAFEVDTRELEDGWSVEVMAIPLPVNDTLLDLFPKDSVAGLRFADERAALDEARRVIRVAMDEHLRRPEVECRVFRVSGITFRIYGQTAEEREQRVREITRRLPSERAAQVLLAYEQAEAGSRE